MKEIFLIIGLFFLQTLNAQDIGITEVNVSSISENEINVNLKVITNASEFISSSYSITGNNINLEVCYITYVRIDCKPRKRYAYNITCNR